ncbi:hypothetical protein LCGC14_0223830 [marine sediment metagenome]|uniref:Uncharacterized protein n=1 Tax=marine sediment metagenome TaxID=412755 RepID=A0A0F9UCB0_9ZZZZ
MSNNFRRLMLNENVDIEIIKAIDELISDDVYAAAWNAITDVAPSKNAVYDKIESIAAAAVALIEDDVYGVGWNGDTTHAPSQNAVYDKIAAMDILIDANSTTTEVETIIIAEIVDGQSIDNAIDSLIATHKAIAGDHHAKYTDAEVDARIVVQNTNPAGTIDIAIDALISTHTGVATAHHTATVAGDLNHNDLANINAGTVYEHISAAQVAALHAVYTDAEAVAAIAAADVYLKLVGDTMNGDIDMGFYDINNVNRISTRAESDYDKLRVYNLSVYTIGMHSAMTYGGLNDWAMTFTMNPDADRGFVWRDSDDAQNDGAMSLTTGGILTVKSSIKIGTGATITTLGDIAALANSDVKVPTNTTVKEYADLMLPLTGGQMSGNIVMDGNDIKSIGNIKGGIEAGIFWATYNFKDVPVGTEGTDIPFIDAATLYDGECIIVDEWQGHKKVLRLQDDATGGEDPTIYHSITQATSGTHEFWIGTNDVTKYWEFYTFEGGVGYINRLRITASSMDYYNGAAWVALIVVSNNILYHVQLVWRADNTQDIYVNDVLEANNVSTDDNMVSGVNRIHIKCFGDSTDYFYLDAYGEKEDPNYTVGDNYTPLINSAGMTLHGTQVITSADEDLTFTFGRAALGSTTADWMVFSHRDMLSGTNYALAQNATGLTLLNAATGQSVVFRINNSAKMTMTATELTMGIPIVMGTSKITGLGNGSAAQDAMAFGQKYTDAEAHAYIEANALVITGGLQMNGVNITMAGAETVDGVDVSALSITNMPTAVNNWKVYCTNGAGVMTEIATGAAATILIGNGVAAAPSFQAQPAPVAHVHDGDTLQFDGINSNGGAFAFATTGSISIDMVNAGATVFSINNSGAGVASLDITGNITVSGTVDGVDIAARDHAATVGGDLTHDSITLPNGNVNEQHLTAAQVTALHTAPSNTAYAASWNGVTTIAPSKNAVYDKIQALIAVWG